MKICLYSPYIPKHVGGGEKYLFDVALVLAERHQVCIAIPQQEMSRVKEIKSQYERFLDRSLNNITFIPSWIGSKASFFEKLKWTKQFDVMYYLTDGSLFFSQAKRNILHIQFPLQLNKSNLIERLKLRNWQVKNTNSEFTKRVVEKSWPVTINVVHHPSVDVDSIIKLTSNVKKEKVILNVGRFFRQLHSKRQDVLVELFRKLTEQNSEQLKGWKLVLIGSVEDQTYLDEIKQKIGALPIEILTSVSRQELLEWYGKASMYWHAAGYGIDEKVHPERVEHFGISTVEAMAAGCVPVVHGKGGQIEVLGEELHELLWLSDEECIARTAQLISEKNAMTEWSKKAQQRAKVFGPEVFAQKLWQMVEGTP